MIRCIIMNGYVLVVLALLVARIEARPQETTPASVEKSGEVTEKKVDEAKSGEVSPVTSTETTEKSNEADSGDTKVKRATDETATQEKSGDSSTEAATPSPVEGKSGQDTKDSKSGESSEAPKVEEREATEEKSADKVDENKSSDVSDKSGVNERTVTAEKSGADESKSSKDTSKDGVEQKSASELSTSTEVVQYRSAYGSSSILETKGRSGETEESNSSEIKGQAHMNLRVPPVNPLAVVNDLGSRRMMSQPNLMQNLPQPFASPLHILPNPPASFNRYLNPPSVNVPKVPSVSQERTFDTFRPETNAYPYSPTSSQQVDSLPKLPSLQNLSKLPSYPNTFYKPYDQNFSGNYGARPRRYTVPDNVNRYAYNNFGYPHYIK